MINIFFKTALRQINKYRFHSVLNILGLSLSMACCLFIYTFNTYQLSFDRFHQNAERTFMVVQDLHLDKIEHDKGGAYAMYDAIEKELPQVEKAAIYIDKQEVTVNVNDRLFKTGNKAAFASSAYFDVMDFVWLEGSPSQLDKPNNVALTKSLAKNYFGQKDAMGQTILVEGKFPVKVVGVIDDRIKNSNFRSEIYFSLASMRELRQIPENDGFFTNWGYMHTSNNILLTLNNPQDREQVEKSISELVAKHWDKEMLKYYTYKLLPLTFFHFDTDYGKATQISLLYILIAIAIGIMMMASINYTNMVSDQQLYRSTEMGIRKVMGSSKKQLFVQFMIESLLISFIAVVFAWIFFWISLDYANQYLFINEPIQIISIWEVIAISILIWFGISVLTSIFPAFFLSKTNIQAALKKETAGNWNLGRKSFIVFQNVIALVLITSTVVIVSQVDYLKNTDMGFQREAVLVFSLKKEMFSAKEKVSNFLLNRTDIQSFTFCDNPPSNEKAWGGTFQFDDRAEWETWPSRYAIGDSSYINTFGIQLIAGRNFKNDPNNPEFLINEKMANDLGFKDPAKIIGKSLLAGGLNDEFKGVIVGVVKDFSTKSLNEPIAPTLIGLNESRFKNLALKYTGNNPARLLSDLKNEWKTWYPNEVFEYKFYDEQIANLYHRETLLEKLIWIAAIISVVISSIGFLGLLSIMIIKRKKEIGIRKVLGSSVSGIVQLLSKDFMKWVILAFLIAVPIGWYAMNKWLDYFVYRIEIQWWMFALMGVLGIVITLITISFQALKAAVANPVDSLRDE